MARALPTAPPNGWRLSQTPAALGTRDPQIWRLPIWEVAEPAPQRYPAVDEDSSQPGPNQGLVEGPAQRVEG